MDKLERNSRESGELDQRLSQGLKDQLRLQIDALNHDLREVINKLEKNFTGANELGKKLAAIKDSFNQMNCDSKDMNQNIRQIRVFFEQIERHLDFKK
jgi:hypothetical protein